MSAKVDGTRRTAILRAAEEVFGHYGFRGASIRLIASAARVNSALVGYYFGSKSDLYEAVFASRYQGITQERLDHLAGVSIAPGSVESLREVLDALLRPFVVRLHTEESRDFAMVLANEALDPRASERRIFEKYLNPTARRFIAAIKRAVPGISRVDSAWGYQFCVFVMLTGASSTQRVGVLSGGGSSRESTSVLTKRMVSFCAAGITAIANGEPRRQRTASNRIRSIEASS